MMPGEFHHVVDLLKSDQHPDVNAWLDGADLETPDTAFLSEHFANPGALLDDTFAVLFGQRREFGL